MKKSLVVLVLLGGCSLYWGDDSGDDVCNQSGGAAIAPSQEYVDPSTGQCEGWGGGGCGGCQPCAYEAVAAPDWAMCYSSCSGLGEDSCLATPGCHADYTVVYAPGPGPIDTFWQCVATPSTGTIDGGTCTGLDAQSCSQHDDCASDYDQDSSGNSRFSSCDPEATAPGCTSVDCGPGYHCDEECYPCDGSGSTGSGGMGSGGGSGTGSGGGSGTGSGGGSGTGSGGGSGTGSGGGSGTGSGSGGGSGSGSGCMDTCSPACVPDQTCANVDCGPGYTCAMECSSGTCYPTCISSGGGPGDCNGQVTCNSAPPQCPANTTPGVANGCYTGYCIPLSQCGPADPGQCYGQVTCNIAAPSCPMGTLPGVVNGCWSGFCIPTGNCEVAACETLTDETSCESRMDCIPVYNGTDCTCTPSGCTCATETWERCESALMPL